MIPCFSLRGTPAWAFHLQPDDYLVAEGKEPTACQPDAGNSDEQPAVSLPPPVATPLQELPTTVLPPLSLRQRIGQVLNAYYSQAVDFSASADEQLAWYSSLPAQAKVDMLILGPHQWNILPAFRRYMLERRGCHLADFMALRLSPEELHYWVHDLQKAACWLDT